MCEDCRRVANEMTADYKRRNKDRIQKMNLFYRMTKDMSKEDRDKLKAKFQKEHNIESVVKGSVSDHRKPHTNRDGVAGKECSVADCGWRPLTEYNANTKHWDGLRTTCKGCMARYRTQNREKMNEYHKKKLLTDECFKIRQRVKVRIHSCLNKVGLKKDQRTEDILGCSIEYFRQYLESKFSPGMSWDNFGNHADNGQKQIGWHIDHIIPCASWNLTDPVELKLCFHYRNCTPMWGLENLSKCAKFSLDDKRDYIEEMKSVISGCVTIPPPEPVIEPPPAVTNDVEWRFREEQCLEAMRVMFFQAENPSGDGYKSSLFSRMKNMESRKRGSENPKSRKVCQHTLDDTRTLIKTFDSISIAARELGVCYVSISNCCRGKVKSAGGYFWTHHS